MKRFIVIISVFLFTLSFNVDGSYWHHIHYNPDGISLKNASEGELGGFGSCWIVGDYGKVIRVDNYTEIGAEYTLFGGAYDFSGVCFVDGYHGWIVGNKRDDPSEGGIILKTEDGGVHWLIVTPSEYADKNFFDVDFVDLYTGFVSCSERMVIYSTNGGFDWQETEKNPTLNKNTCLTRIEATSVLDIWVAADDDGLVAHSMDMGVNWTTKQPFDYDYYNLPDPGQTHPGKLAHYQIIPYNSEVAYMAVSDTGICVTTTNGGNLWEYYKNSKIFSGEQWIYAMQFAWEPIPGPVSYAGSSGIPGSISKHYDFLDYSSGYQCQGVYLVGDREKVTYDEWDWNPLISGSIWSLLAIGDPTWKVSIDWWADNGYDVSKEVTVRFFRSFCRNGPFKQVAEETITMDPYSTYWGYTDDIIEDDIPYHVVHETTLWYHIEVKYDSYINRDASGPYSVQITGDPN